MVGSLDISVYVYVSLYMKQREDILYEINFSVTL